MQSVNSVQKPIPNQSSTSNVSLKNGQLIYGKVHHIHSNQTAEISIGNAKILAKLDAPITAGERYLFQVQNSGEMTMLKVLPSAGKTQTIQERAQSLMQHLSIVSSKESLALAKFFVKNNIPITKEQLLHAIQWANSTGDPQKALQALKMMNELSLPFKEPVYQAMVAYENKISLPTLFSGILKGLEGGITGNERALRTLLTHFLSTDVEKQADIGVRKLLSAFLSSEGEMKNTVFRILQEIGYFSKQEKPSDILVNTVQRADITASQLNGKQTAQLLFQLFKNSNENHSDIVSPLVSNSLQKSREGTAEQSMWKEIQNVLKNTDEANQPASQLASMTGGEKNVEQAKQNLGNILLQLRDGKSSLKGEAHFLQSFLQEEITALSTPKAEYVANELKTTFRLLGLGFENHLGSLEQGTIIKEQELVTLKPLLLKQLAETHSQSMKDQVELLLNKITAQQILSQSSGPIQHLILQFPFSLQHNQHEVMMQWSGRKKQDGSIDPMFCRILFYLQLDHLKETVIDVVVQNSIMKVMIMNEQAPLLKAVSQPYLTQMKEKLKEAGYQVSSISFEKPASSRTSLPHANEKNTSNDPVSYSGVDIKI